MKKIKYPKSEKADICLLLEGTYPFTRGGVSNWAYELIKVFPQFKFAIIFLGTKKKDYHGLLYPLLPNVVHLDAYYLYDRTRILDYSTRIIKKKTMKKVEALHERCAMYATDKTEDIPELFDLMKNNREINARKFLRSRDAWDFIVKQYQKNYSDQSFFDYFWSVRGLHQPFWHLKKIVDRVPQAKVIHSASTGYAGFLGALLHKKHGTPFILTEHGIYTNERWIELMRNYFFEKAAQKNLLHNNELNLTNMWINFFKIMAKTSYSSANAIVSLFEGHRQYQITDGALPERTKIISYGIDFNKYQFLNKKLNKETPIIAFIGRVVPIKDVKNFIRTIALILQRKPETEAWIAGSLEEDPDYASYCKSLVEYLGLENKIKFLGFCDVTDVYKKIDLVIMSSISEGSPFTILESFAVGIPVVATNVGACKELIIGKNSVDESIGMAGGLVNIADPDATANAALELLNNESKWIAAQQAGLQRVKTYYSMDKLIENYDNIYKEAISTWQE